MIYDIPDYNKRDLEKLLPDTAIEDITKEYDLLLKRSRLLGLLEGFFKDRIQLDPEDYEKSCIALANWNRS